jgi:predicted GIY-YIG superfamily endonuclease
MFYVYILKNAEDIFYVGQTNNLERRVSDHNSNHGAKFTKDTMGMKLVYSERFSTRADAMKREMQLKKWSRAKKLALISGDMELLKMLSKGG